MGTKPPIASHAFTHKRFANARVLAGGQQLRALDRLETRGLLVRSRKEGIQLTADGRNRTLRPHGIVLREGDMLYLLAALPLLQMSFRLRTSSVLSASDASEPKFE